MLIKGLNTFDNRLSASFYLFLSTFNSHIHEECLMLIPAKTQDALSLWLGKYVCAYRLKQTAFKLSACTHTRTELQLSMWVCVCVVVHQRYELQQSPHCLASRKRYFQIGSHFSVRRKKLKSLWLPSKRFYCMLFVRGLFVSLMSEHSSYYT